MLFYGSGLIERGIEKVERLHAPAIQAALFASNDDPISEEQQLVIRQYLLVQRVRTLDEREKSSPAVDQLFRTWLRSKMGLRESLSERDQRVLECLDLVRLDPKPYQLRVMAMAAAAAPLLADLRLTILLNQTAIPFGLSDSPVIVTNPYLWLNQDRGILGYSQPGIQVYCPISPERCLFLYDPRAYAGSKSEIVEVEERDAITANKLQLHAARSTFYFRDPELRRRYRALWRQEKGTFKTAAVITRHFSFADRQVHLQSERPLPLLPRLSFLEYVPMPAGQYQGEVRDKGLMEEFVKFIDSAGIWE